MGSRLLPILNSFLIRRVLPVGRSTLAGLIKGKKTTSNSIACRMIIRYTPNEKTIAGKLTLRSSVSNTFAGMVTLYKATYDSIASSVFPYRVRHATIASVLTMQNSRRTTFPGIITGYKTMVRGVGGLLILCTRNTIGGVLTCYATSAETIANVIVAQKTKVNTIACTIKLAPPAWDQGMMGG